MRTRRLTAGFGLEMQGCDTDAPGMAAQLLGLLAEHQLLVLPAQHLSADALVRLNRALGEPDLQTPRQFLLESHPEIFVISNIVQNGRAIGSTMSGFGWHTDMIYAARPTALTMLAMQEVPRIGGATLFSSTRRAYEALPDAERERLRRAWSIHSVETMYARRRGSPAVPPEARMPSVRHPLVRRHPVGGWEALYLSRNSLADVEAEDASVTVETVEALIAHATSPGFTYAHKSAPGDLLLWDNRGLLHSATDYDFAGDRRLAYRLVTAGEVPLAAA